MSSRWILLMRKFYKLSQLIHDLTTEYPRRMLDAFMTPPIAAPWCNGRIICLGSIPAGQTDLPPEWYELPLELRSKLRRAINELPVPLLFERSKRTLYHAALKTFTAIPFSADLKLPGLPPSTKDRKIAARTAAKHEELFFLRNHSTKEYVSGAMIGALGTTHGIPLTLGHAILARSCWAFYTDDAVHSFADEGIHRGVWAGHQYDVVHEDEWPRKIRKQWQNVSEEVGAEVISAWKMYLSA